MATNNVIGTPAISLGNTFSTSGNYPLTFTLTGSTNVTLPTTGNVILQSSPTINTPNIVGVTNGSDAAAGSVGEYVSAVLTNSGAISFATNTPTTILSLMLAAGDWDMWANAVIIPTATGTFSQGISCISDTNNTLADVTTGNAPISYLSGLTETTGLLQTLFTGLFRISLAAPVTYYLVVSATFTGFTPTRAYGYIAARRRR